MKSIACITIVLGFSATTFAATARYSLEKTIASFREPDGRLSIQLGGHLEIRVKDERYIRVPVRGADGRVWIEPLRVTLTSVDGEEFPGGFSVCSVSQRAAEVLVQSSFTFTIDAGAAFVPKAGQYKARIEVRATGADGQDFLLETESTFTVQEPNQVAEGK